MQSSLGASRISESSMGRMASTTVAIVLFYLQA